MSEILKVVKEAYDVAKFGSMLKYVMRYRKRSGCREKRRSYWWRSNSYVSDWNEDLLLLALPVIVGLIVGRGTLRFMSQSCSIAVKPTKTFFLTQMKNVKRGI